MSYLGQGHADTGSGRNPVGGQTALFLPATHCPGSDQLQRTAQGGKAHCSALQGNAGGRLAPQSSTGNEGGTGGRSEQGGDRQR